MASSELTVKVELKDLPEFKALVEIVKLLSDGVRTHLGDGEMFREGHYGLCDTIHGGSVCDCGADEMRLGLKKLDELDLRAKRS